MTASSSSNATAYLTPSGSAVRRTARTTTTTEREFDEQGRVTREVVTEETVEEEEPANLVQWSPTWVPQPSPNTYPNPSYPTSPFWWTTTPTITCNGEAAA